MCTETFINNLFKQFKSKTMGRYTNGANGSFAGTVGSVVGASWKNISYMKSKRKAGTFKPSHN